jgi:hypothetical protein
MLAVVYSLIAPCFPRVLDSVENGIEGFPSLVKVPDRPAKRSNLAFHLHDASLSRASSTLPNDHRQSISEFNNQLDLVIE